MKKLIVLSLSLVSAFALASGKSSVITITDGLARNVFNSLTGPAVIKDGAMGSSYRTGKDVACRYVQTDLVTRGGDRVPQDDPSRYSCKIVMDANGSVLPAGK